MVPVQAARSKGRNSPQPPLSAGFSKAPNNATPLAGAARKGPRSFLGRSRDSPQPRGGVPELPGQQMGPSVPGGAFWQGRPPAAVAASRRARGRTSSKSRGWGSVLLGGRWPCSSTKPCSWEGGLAGYSGGNSGLFCFSRRLWLQLAVNPSPRGRQKTAASTHRCPSGRVGRCCWSGVCTCLRPADLLVFRRRAGCTRLTWIGARTWVWSPALRQGEQDTSHLTKSTTPLCPRPR